MRVKFSVGVLSFVGICRVASSESSGESKFWLSFCGRLRVSRLFVFSLTIFERLFENRQLLTEYAESFAFCAGASFQPLVELQPSFHMDGHSFFNSRLCEIGLLAHDSDFYKRRFFSPFVSSSLLPTAIDGKSEFSNRSPLRGISNFRVTGNVSSDHN